MNTPGFTDIFAMLQQEVREQRVPEPFLGYSDTRFYTNPEWYEKEKAALFRDNPMLVGHTSMLKQTGDVFTHDHLGQPIMVVCGKDNTVRAFLNVCRHRGVRLVNLSAMPPTRPREYPRPPQWQPAGYRRRSGSFNR